MEPKLKMVTLKHIKYNLLGIMLFTDPKNQGRVPASKTDDDTVEGIHCKTSVMPSPLADFFLDST